MTTADADVAPIRVPGTQVATRASGLPAKVHYAQALASSGLLPASYRKNPANILWAMEYGEMLGLTPMAAITGVHVIEGKPSASAGLISALVRRAGHKLRVSGDSSSATCQIVRSDDPGYTFEVTFTLKDAAAAGLTGKAVWKQYAAAMLKARAITQCARDACEEALFGLHYTPEELGADVDEDGVVLPCDADAGQEPDVVTVEGAGTDDDPWYVRAAPDGNGNGHPPQDDGTRWVDQALPRAANWKTEAAGQELWREASAAVLDGRATPHEADHVKNIINARLADRRLAAADGILKPVAGDAPLWRSFREKILALDDDEEARSVLAEVQQAIGAGQLDDARAKLLGRAIVALRPKAALAGETDG